MSIKDIAICKKYLNPKGEPFYVKKVFISDIDEIQNLASIMA